MKTKTRIQYIITLICVLSIILCQSVFAQTAELVNLETENTIIVSVAYQKSEPQIQLIAPNGHKYTSDNAYDEVVREAGITYYQIDCARTGKWSIEYDKKDNETIMVNVTKMPPTLNIESLDVGDCQNNMLDLSVSVSCAKKI